MPNDSHQARASSHVAWMALLERIAREPEVWSISEASTSPSDELVANFLFMLGGSPNPECHRIDADSCQAECDIVAGGTGFNEPKNVVRVRIILIRSEPAGFPTLDHANWIPMAQGPFDGLKPSFIGVVSHAF